MIYVATFVPLGALAVAALGLVLAYKDRIASHRTTLYDRQLQAYEDITRELGGLHSEIVAFVVGGPIPEDRRMELRQLVAMRSAAYQDVFRQGSVILPRAVATALIDYRTVLNAISAPATVASQYDQKLAYADDPIMDLSKAFQRVLEAMREHAGADKLSSQTVAMIGSKPMDSSIPKQP